MRLLHVSAAPKNSKNGQLPDIFSKNTAKSQVKRKDKSPENRDFIEFSATKEPPHIPPLPNLENSSPTSPSPPKIHTQTPDLTDEIGKNTVKHHTQISSSALPAPIHTPISRLKTYHSHATFSANDPNCNQPHLWTLQLSV